MINSFKAKMSRKIMAPILNEALKRLFSMQWTWSASEVVYYLFSLFLWRRREEAET